MNEYFILTLAGQKDCVLVLMQCVGLCLVSLDCSTGSSIQRIIVKGLIPTIDWHKNIFNFWLSC